MLLYEGPSRIDGKPIVCIATAGSKNPKTGDMVQTWIMRADVSPVEAVRSQADASVCGDCPQRHALGGGCYVQPFQAPRSVWEAWKRGAYESETHRAKMGALLRSIPLRLGAYGDPVAVPLETWRPLLAVSPGHTGYTHQWRHWYAQAYKRFLMASCDSVTEAQTALQSGWRYFLVTKPETPLLSRSVECLADARGMSCADCGICDGAKMADKRASVWISVHGARSKNYKLNVVR